MSNTTQASSFVPVNEPSTATLPIAVLGAGAWGSALALQLARAGRPVRLWSREVKSDTPYLSDSTLKQTISVCTGLREAVDGVNEVLVAVPSHAFCEVLKAVKPHLGAQTALIWGTKGLGEKAGHACLLHELVLDVLGDSVSQAVLSGPSFANEVAHGLPTAVVIASEVPAVAAHWVERFHTEMFRVYQSDDMVGVQVGGGVKNIIAVAVGASEALGLGKNASSALITRGLAEMTRFGCALGGKPATFTGLAGVGDLVLTCTSNLSRNYRFGFGLGRGKTSEAVQSSITEVVESVHNVKEVYECAKQHGIEMPITEQVKRVVFDGVPAKEAVKQLLARKPTIEHR